MKNQPHQVSAWCSAGTAEEKQDAGFPSQGFAHPSALGFHTCRNLIHCHEGRLPLPPDFASLYGVEVGQLNRQVKRNLERFPDDFMFQLSHEECSRCQIGTLNGGRGSNIKYLPYVFTENGVAMLSGVLRSPRAIAANIQIMRAFVAMRKALASIAPLLARIDATERWQIADQAKNDANQVRNEERFTQMLGNAALMALPKVVFLSSRRVEPAAVIRCYDWATGLRGGGRGATALPMRSRGTRDPAELMTRDPTELRMLKCDDTLAAKEGVLV